MIKLSDKLEFIEEFNASDVVYVNLWVEGSDGGVQVKAIASEKIKPDVLEYLVSLIQ